MNTIPRAFHALAFVVALAGIGAMPSAAAVAISTRHVADAPGAADSVLTAGEWEAIRKVIGDQLAALRGGDAAHAYAYATRALREQFHDPDTFFAMVQGSYAALLDARYTAFLEGAVIDGNTIQPLRLVMSDDTVQVALYRMEKEDDGRWHIAGCVIAPSTVRAA